MLWTDATHYVSFPRKQSSAWNPDSRIYLLRNSGPAAYNPWPRGPINAAQHKIVNLIKRLFGFITKFCTKFYYLLMYIFYIGEHKLGTRSTI